MTITKQIIDEVVTKSIKTELIPINYELIEIKTSIKELTNKVDHLTDNVVDLAGSVRKFDEEQLKNKSSVK